MSTNQALFEQAQSLIPGGVNSPVRAFRSVGGTPRFITHGQGPYVWDVEDTRYIDYVGSWGAGILGHADPSVFSAVQTAAAKGLSFGMPTAGESELAETIMRILPSIERIRFVSSGTEAAMTAIRLARGMTGRDRIIKFEGCYHGHTDSLLVKAGSGLLTLGQASSQGVPAVVANDTLVLNFNHTDELHQAFKQYGSQIAAVIVEPIAGNMNLVLGEPDFLRAIQELCTQYGALCIFDEVMTGFRVGLHSAQGRYQITPDITLLGKVIGGGLPVAAIGGRRSIIEGLSPLGGVYQAGTLSGNPVAVASGLATLRAVQAPRFYEKLEQHTREWVDGFNTAAREVKLPFCADKVGGMFGLYAGRSQPPKNYAEVMQMDKILFNRFFHSMLEHGIHLAPSAYEAGFVSSTHDETVIQESLSIVRSVFQKMK